MIIIKKQKIAFLSIFCLVTFQALFIITISAETTSTVDYWNRQPLLTNANMDVTLENYGSLKSAIQVKFDGITPTGSEKQSNNITKFTAKGTYIITIDLWSELAIDQAISFSPSSSSVQWLKLETFATQTFATPVITDYFVSYNYLAGGSVTAAGQGFSGNIKINPTLKDITPSKLDFGNDIVTVTTKNFVATVDQLTVMQTKTNEITYQTKIAEIGQTTFTANDVAKNPSAAISKAGEGGTQLSSKISEMALGVSRLTPTESTVQQSVCSPPIVGSNTGLLTNGISVNLRPEITKISEPLKVRYAKVGVDTETDWAKTSPAGVIASRTSTVTENTVNRVIAYKIKQSGMQIVLKADVTIFSYCKVDYLKQDIPTMPLADPQLGEMIYDSTLTGNTGATVIVDTESDLDQWFSDIWDKYWWAILLVILILIGIGVVAFMISPAGQAVTQMNMQRKQMQIQQEQMRQYQQQRSDSQPPNPYQ